MRSSKSIMTGVAVLAALALPMVAGAANKLVVNGTDGSTPAMVVTDTGTIGVGTNAPDAGLYIKGATYPANTVKVEGVGGGGIIAYTPFTTTYPGSSTRLGYQYFGAIDVSTTPAKPYHATGFFAGASATWTSTSTPSFFAFETTPAGSTTRTERMRIAADGNVGIGTTAPSHKLEIANGGIRFNNNAVQPTCDNTTAAGMRGTIWFVKGATGVADSLQICARNAAGSYAWRTVTLN